MYYNLLIAQHLWLAHCHIMSIIFLKKYIIKCKYKHDDKKSETCRIKYKHCDCFLEYKDGLIEYKYLCCIKNYQTRLDQKLKDLTTLEICILKYMNLILQNFFHLLD